VSFPSNRIQLVNVKVPASFVLQSEGLQEGTVDDCLHVNLLVENQQVTAVHPHSQVLADTQIIDAQGNIVLPKFTEVHVHLDKCHSIGRMKDVGGDLVAAIQEQAKDKTHWTEQDIRQRAEKGLQELYQAGCQAVRTHLDWSDGYTPPDTWHTMLTLASEWQHKMQVQCAPLIDISLFQDLAKADPMVARIAQDKAVLGAFVLGHDNLELCLANLFELAKKYNVDVDFHVDEGMDPALNGIEVMADALLASQYQGHVLCGHVCNLMNYEQARLNVLMDKLAKCNVSICALPSTNLYLQGRLAGTPDRRGITRIRELKNYGINVAIGTDNVCDAFCPIGRHDPLNSLALGVVTAHLDPPFDQWLDCITTNASKAIGLSPTFLDGAAVDKLLMTNAKNTAELIAGGIATPRCLASVLTVATNNQEKY